MLFLKRIVVQIMMLVMLISAMLSCMTERIGCWEELVKPLMLVRLSRLTNVNVCVRDPLSILVMLVLVLFVCHIRTGYGDASFHGQS